MLADAILCRFFHRSCCHIFKTLEEGIAELKSKMAQGMRATPPGGGGVIAVCDDYMLHGPCRCA